MMWPGPSTSHSSRARFQCTTCQPPVPSPRSTAVVFTTTGSSTATGPVSCVSTYAGPASVSTRCSPRRSARIAVTLAVRSCTSSEGGDEALDPLVLGLERVLAEHRALCLVVELEMHPVDRVVALALLGPLDERPPQPRPRRLGRRRDGGLDVGVVHDPVDLPAPLQQVVERPRARHVVV